MNWTKHSAWVAAELAREDWEWLRDQLDARADISKRRGNYEDLVSILALRSLVVKEIEKDAE